MDQPRRSADPTGWQAQPDPSAAHTVHPGPPPNGTVAWASPPSVEAEDEDLDLLAEVNHGPSRATVLLIAGILATLAFIGGVVVQKHYGGTTSGRTPAAAGGFGVRAGGAGGYGGAGGAPGGGFPGGGGTGTGAGGIGTGAGGGQAGYGNAGGAGAAAGGGSANTATTPVVVGTVTKLSGSSLTVKNLGGKSVKVTVPEGATITLVAGKSLTALKVGATVSVAGKTGANGTVTATAVTVRS